MKSYKIYYTLLILLLLVLFILNICLGAVYIPLSDVIKSLFGGGDNEIHNVILTHSRLPQAITATMSGAALAISGLMLQTLFNNPLASPSILGISSGASVGVAVVTLLFGGSIASMGLAGHIAITVGAMVGAFTILTLILLFSIKVKNSIMLLIVGIMLGYVASSVVSLLSFLATSEGVYSFVMWGLGNFSAVSSQNLYYFVSLISVALIISILLVKSLNGLLLGEEYCENLGINVKRARLFIIISTGLLTSVVTAFCGPISFIGLATAHIARLMLGTSNHRHLLPVTILIGSSMTLICNLLSNTIGGGVIVPINVITPFLGAPVIIYVIVNKNKIPYFNQ